MGYLSSYINIKIWGVNSCLYIFFACLFGPQGHNWYDCICFVAVTLYFVVVQLCHSLIYFVCHCSNWSRRFQLLVCLHVCSCNQLVPMFINIFYKLLLIGKSEDWNEFKLEKLRTKKNETNTTKIEINN